MSDRHIEDALRDLRVASEMLRLIIESGVASGAAYDEALERKNSAASKLDRAIARESPNSISSLTRALTDEARRRPKPHAEIIPRHEEPFTVLEKHSAYEPGVGGVDSTGPTIVISFDIRRSYIEKFGYFYARKLPGVVLNNLSDYVNAASQSGTLKFQELIQTVSGTTGVARIKQILINGDVLDVETTPGKAIWPSRVDVVDVRISEGD